MSTAKLSYAAVVAKPAATTKQNFTPKNPIFVDQPVGSIELSKQLYKMVSYDIFHTIMHESLPNLYKDEELTSDEKQNILLSANILLDNYVSMKSTIEIPDVYNGSSKDKIERHLEVLVLTALMIVLKWYLDIANASTSTFVEYSPMSLQDNLIYPTLTKLLIKTEKDILKTFDYNIFKYMPCRTQEDICEGSPIVKHNDLPVSAPKEKPERTCKRYNIWKCLCMDCIRVLDTDMSYAYDAIPYNSGVSLDYLCRLIKENRDVAAEKPYCIRTQTNRLYQLCSLRKSNPDTFWQVFARNRKERKKWIEKIRSTVSTNTYKPYRIIVELLVGL